MDVVHVKPLLNPLQALDRAREEAAAAEARFVRASDTVSRHIEELNALPWWAWRRRRQMLDAILRAREDSTRAYRAAVQAEANVLSARDLATAWVLLQVMKRVLFQPLARMGITVDAPPKPEVRR